MLALQSCSDTSFFKNVLLFVLIFSCSVIDAQVDSLANKSYTELTSLFKTTIDKDAKRASHYAAAAYKLALKSKKQQKIGQSLYFLAKANFDLSKNTLALQQLTEVVNIATTLKDSSLLFKGNALKGNVYSDLGDEFSALDSYLEAKKSSAYTEKSSDLILLSINIAFIKKIHRDYEDAVKVLKENLALLETTTIDPKKKERYELITLMNLTDTYLRMKENGESQYIKEAEFYNKKGLVICGENKDTIYYYVLLMNEAIIHYEKSEYQQSIAIADELLAYAEEKNDEGFKCTSNFYLGKNYFQLKNHAESIRFLDQAYDIMKTSERSYSNEKELHSLLIKNYLYTEELEKANFHFEMYSKLEKEQSKKDVEIIGEIHKENDLPELQKELENLAVSLDSQKRNKIYLYVALALLFFLLIISVVFYKRKVKNVKKKVAQVMQKVTDLERSKKQVRSKTNANTETITDKNALKILAKLDAFEEKEEFLVQGCTLIYVAEKLKSNTTYLSKVINTYKGKTFNSYLNELRINKALIQLKNDSKLRSYTIKGISEEFGFKRQETFSRAFKQQTGIYPSQYLKKVNQTIKDD